MYIIDTIVTHLWLLSTHRSQGSACHPSSSCWSRTGHISWHGSSTGPSSSSAAWGPAPSTSPPATPSSLQLYHGNVHVQFVHVRRGISESSVHDEDRSALLRAHAPFVWPAVPPAPPLSTSKPPASRPSAPNLLPSSQSAPTHPILPPSRLQPQLPPSAPAYATRAQCAPSGNGLTACWLPTSTRPTSGAAAAPRHATCGRNEQRGLDEMRGD